MYLEEKTARRRYNKDYDEGGLREHAGRQAQEEKGFVTQKAREGKRPAFGGA